jgi:anti-sigma factor RsiW
VQCRDLQAVLNAYSDGELDLVRHLQAEHHLAECAECAAREQSLRQLREAIAVAPLVHHAPDSLRTRVRSIVSVTTRPQSRRLWPLILAATGGAIAASALMAIVLAVWGSTALHDDRLADQLLAAHVRSLQVGHLTDVASSNRHTVKPWFRGKLDFSPQVPDLADHGFPLTGGRLDYAADRPVAALVYAHRQHVINLFVWAASVDDARTLRPAGRQGFHVRAWHQDGMAYGAVSDLNPEELDEFVRLFREAVAPSP